MQRILRDLVCSVTSAKLVSRQSGKAREGETTVAIQKTYALVTLT